MTNLCFEGMVDHSGPRISADVANYIEKRSPRTKNGSLGSTGAESSSGSGKVVQLGASKQRRSKPSGADGAAISSEDNLYDSIEVLNQSNLKQKQIGSSQRVNTVSPLTSSFSAKLTVSFK